jgi:hypothetical protein
VPLVEGSDSFLLARLHSAIFEEAITKYSTQCLRQLEHLWDDTRASQENVAVLELKASPALADDHEIGNLLPKALAHLDEEGVRVGLYGVCCPVAAVLISDNYLAI